MLWFILLTIGFLWIILFRWQRRGIYKMAEYLKSDFKSFPIVGHLPILTEVRNGEDFFRKIKEFGIQANKHGGMSYLWLGPVFSLVVTDPKTTDTVWKKCLDKHYATKYLDMFMGNGSLIAPVHIWRNRRKAIMPIFRQQNLNYFVDEIFSRQSRIMVDRLREVNGKGSFSMWEYINRYAFDIFSEGIMGVQLKAQYNPHQPFLKALESCSKLATDRIYKIWLQFSPIYRLFPHYKAYRASSKVIIDFIDQIIRNKRKEIQINGNETNDVVADAHKYHPKPLLDHLLGSFDSPSKLTNEECREEMVVLALAATETTSAAVSFACVLLSRHSDIQEKVYEELLQVFGDSDRVVETVDLPRLTYLEAVIKEVLRLYPPLPGISRNTTEDVQLSPDITIVKGIGIGLNIWAMHRNPKYWGEDAEVFRPERFLDAPLKHPEAYIPFSTGPRNCPGYRYAMMSMKTSLATLLRSYHLLPATVADETSSIGLDKSLRLRFETTLKDDGGFQIRIKSRV